MNFKFPSSLDNAPPNPGFEPMPHPNSSYFTQQAIRAGYATGEVSGREINGLTTASDARRHEFEALTSTTDVRRREFEGFPSANDARRREFERFTSTSNVGRREFEYPSNPVDVWGSNPVDVWGLNPVDVRGSMHREMEKERLRAEIIAEEMMRKRVLEEDLRREIMRERELEYHRDYGIAGSTELMRREPRQPPLSSYYEHRDRIDGAGTWSHREDDFRRGFDRDYRDHRVVGGSGSGATSSEIKEVNAGFHRHEASKDKAIVLGKPSANLAYLKRKTMVPPVGGSTEVFKKQKVKDNWRCALCQVSATSERGLNDHLRGKKHQAREEETGCHRTGFGAKPLPNTFTSNTVKPLTLLSVPSTPTLEKNGKQCGESSLAKANKAPSRNAIHTPLKLKMTSKAPATAKRSNKQRKGFQFYCEMCQIGANSITVFDAHNKGKKHLANLSLLNKTDEASQNPDDSLVKSTGTSTIGGNQDAKGTATDEGVKPKKKFEFFCKICQIGSNSIKVFDAHNKGKKHLANLSLLNKASQKPNDTLVKSTGTSTIRGNRDAKGSATGERGKPKKKFEFFCEICQIGSNALVVFNAHMNGKKHSAKLSELNITDKSARVEESVEKSLTNGESFEESVKKSLTNGENLKCDVEEEPKEISGGNVDNDFKEEFEEAPKETSGGNVDSEFKEEFEEEPKETSGGNVDCDFKEEFEEEPEETSGGNVDCDLKEEFEDTDEENFENDVKSELEETNGKL